LTDDTVAKATGRPAHLWGIRNRVLCALLTGSVAAALILASIGSMPTRGVHASPPPPRTLTGQTPDVVVHGTPTLRGHHDPNAALTLDIGLGVHNPAQLDALIAAASDPASPQYGHYLTNAQYLAQFAPTAQEVQDVRDWA